MAGAAAAAAAADGARPAASLEGLARQLLPLLQWEGIHRLCLCGRGCGREVLRAIHERYLSSSPTAVAARISRLASRLSAAQAAQARGSPDALARAAAEISVLNQCTTVLGKNCENYADLFERLGFTVGEDLGDMMDPLLECLEKVQSFQNALQRLQEVAARTPPPISCRRQAEEGDGYDD
ncbi:unnamed protein product [Prorocentrum cordatum]|uniref:Uncharacterized protein n=1 Tax=Prorocentrum cordatum TaxID=2364126 RepID=A0ABN9T5Q2_9DINO|nr:unnamed protein product [Polarella glacialis]